MEIPEVRNIEISEVWMRTKYSNNHRLVQQGTAEGISNLQNKKSQNAWIMANHRDMNGDT